jgi:hypothetical protein
MGMGPQLAMAMAGAGMATSAIGAYKSASGQKAALNYQSSVAKSNAQIAEEQAHIAQLNGQQEEFASRLKTAATVGDQRAIAAANGVDVSSGSPVEIVASSRYLGERDALTIRDNAARQAWAYNQQATGYRNEAAMDSATADAMNPWMSAAGSLLTGAGTVADRWYKYKAQSVNGVKG